MNIVRTSEMVECEQWPAGPIQTYSREDAGTDYGVGNKILTQVGLDETVDQERVD